MICKQCSKCCQKMAIRIGEPVNNDYKRWASYHNVDIVELDGVTFAVVNNECKFLVDNKCHIQPVKPDLCKQFYCEDPRYKQFKKLL